MTTVTPKERIEKLFKKEPIDAMPVFSGQGMVTIQAIEKMGIRFAEVHTSAEYLARSAMVSAEIFGFDGVVIPYDMCTVPEALGRGASLYKDAEGILYPTVPSKWATLDEVDIPSGYLSKGRMPVVDEALGILKSITDGRFAVGGWVLGPFTMAGQMIELDVLLKGMRKDKERVEAFLSKMTELVIDIARHYQALGVDYMNIREMGTGTDIISPRMWKMSVLDNLKKVFKALDSPNILHICGSTDMIIEMMNECGADALSVDYMNIREMGTGTDIISPRMWKTSVIDNLKKVFKALHSPNILHICGSTDMIIEMMNECGADALSVDQKNDVAESRKKLGNDVLLLGNFDPYGTLVQMDALEVEEVIKKCIDDGVDAVWPGCDIWPEVKKENVETYVRTVREYGKKASPAVGRV